MLGKVLFLIFIHSSLQASTPSSKTYDAAVVEFNFGETSGMDPMERTEANLEKYLDFISSIEDPVDIIVFPEMTFNRMETAVEIPEVNEKISPCDDEKYEADNIVKKLSCSAKHGHYLVVNMITKAKCPDPEMVLNEDPRNCADREDGFSYYNTNVVFDRQGIVISRYRKYNLFGEEVDKPYKPQMATFTTDFGVTFGHFICFDLMFRYPAVELVRHKITDIIFPTMWFSEAPFLTAVQAQQNWAHSHNVNLLAAGANFPGVGSSGTGIYGGNKGAYVLEMAGSNTSAIYRATVHKKISENSAVVIENRKLNRHTKNEMKGLKLKRDQLDVYDMTFLNDTDGSHYNEKSVCRDDFCCNIKVNYTIENSSTKKHYQYVLAFNHGKRTFDGFADGGIVACAILACHNKEVASCGVRDETLENIHKWDSIEIVGKFPTNDGQFLYMPTSLDTSIIPLQPEQFEYNVDSKENEDEITIKLNENAENLLTFGIYGRDFNLDSTDGARNLSISVSLFLFAIFAIFKLM